MLKNERISPAMTPIPWFNITKILTPNPILNQFTILKNFLPGVYGIPEKLFLAGLRLPGSAVYPVACKQKENLRSRR
jgi:hypothetical protein